MMTLSVSSKSWSEAVCAAEQELSEMNHFMNDAADDHRLTEQGIRAALRELKIEIEVTDGET